MGHGPSPAVLYPTLRLWNTLFKKKPLNKSFFDDFKPTQGDRLKKPVLNSANYTNLKALSIIASSHVDSDGRVDRSKFRRPDVTEPRLTKKTFRESILGGRHVKMVVNYDTIMPKIFGPKFPEFTEIVAWWPAVRPSFFSNNRDTEALYKKTLEKYEDKINNAIVNAVFSEAWRLLQEGRSKAARVRSLLQNLDEQNELGKIESIEGPDTDINLDDLSSGDEEEDEEEAARLKNFKISSDKHLLGFSEDPDGDQNLEESESESESESDAEILSDVQDEIKDKIEDEIEDWIHNEMHEDIQSSTPDEISREAGHDIGRDFEHNIQHDVQDEMQVDAQDTSMTVCIKFVPPLRNRRRRDLAFALSKLSNKMVCIRY
ncbi:hypothetical protein H2199_004024 [Coniosporium tulheliwenetii]|uniref:Uncharacterized protein n=1 Tax=Coniosporium tulheliwenetii TaxID=3383036 RepID=A0ACC2Z8N8_9PEZI|nr:hypothetical protein H2199_004024 [Cladosporium sp. JES 115]